MSHKLDDDELGSETATWPQEMLSGYPDFSWLHSTCCHRVVVSPTWKPIQEVANSPKFEDLSRSHSTL